MCGQPSKFSSVSRFHITILHNEEINLSDALLVSVNFPAATWYTILCNKNDFHSWNDRNQRNESRWSKICLYITLVRNALTSREYSFQLAMTDVTQFSAILEITGVDILIPKDHVLYVDVNKTLKSLYSAFFLKQDGNSKPYVKKVLSPSLFFLYTMLH